MRVMIIEDDKDLAENYLHSLPSDWTSEIYPNARDGLFHYLKAPHTYDLVISDVSLGGKSGEAFIFDIKLINPYQNVVVVTGDSQSLNLPEHFGVKVFQKPVLLQDVLRASILQSAS